MAYVDMSSFKQSHFNFFCFCLQLQDGDGQEATPLLPAAGGNRAKHISGILDTSSCYIFGAPTFYSTPNMPSHITVIGIILQR